MDPGTRETVSQFGTSLTTQDVIRTFPRCSSGERTLNNFVETTNQLKLVSLPFFVSVCFVESFLVNKNLVETEELKKNQRVVKSLTCLPDALSFTTDID